MREDELCEGEYRISMRGRLNVNYLGRTTAQEMAIPDDGRRLVFWAPETLVKLALLGKIGPGRVPLRPLHQVIDPGNGCVAGVGIAVVLRREGLDREVYAHLLSGVLDMVSVVPLTGHLTCEVQNSDGEQIILSLHFREIGNVDWKSLSRMGRII